MRAPPSLLACLLTLPLALACGDKDDDTGTAGDGGATDGGAADGGGEDGGAVEGGTLTGRVVYADGSPAAVQMRLCEELCRTATTEADGSFEYLQVEAGHYALEAVNLADQHGYAMPLDFITLDGTSARALTEPIVIPAFATSVELTGGEQQVEVDGGLTVTVDPSVLTASASNSPYLEAGAPDYVAGVAVDPSTLGLPFEDVQGELVAAWFMGRTSLIADPPLPFTSDELYGLSEGETVQVVAAEYDSKVWVDGGTATVTGGRLVSDTGSGIPVLSTVLLLRE